jgi:hypothetical protein
MTDQDVIELEVCLELRDYLWANYWFLFRNMWMRLLVGIAFLPLGAFVYLLVCDPAEGSWSALAPVLVLPVSLILLVVGVYFGAKNSLASNKSLQEAIRYRFSAHGIDAVAASSSGHTEWTNFYRAIETRHSFLLFISRNQMYSIPKRCFHDSQQMSAFRTLLGKTLAERVVLESV